MHRRETSSHFFAKKIVRVTASGVLALAAAAMAFVMAPSQPLWELALALCIAGMTALFWAVWGDVWSALAACPRLLWLPVAGLAWRLLLASDAALPALDSYALLQRLPEPLASAVYGFAGFFMVFVLLWLAGWLWQGARAYWSEVDAFEILFFGILVSFLTVMLFLVYQVTDGYWASVDVIFSIDSGLVSEHMLPDVTYADLRHSVYAFLFWPLHVWFRDLAALTPSPAWTLHLLWGLAGAWMLVALACLLYRLSGRRRHVAIVYVMTMPVWLFCFFVEKYQPAALFAVLTVAALARSDARRAGPWAVAATGCMTSSAPLLLACLATHSPRQFARRAGTLLCSGLGLLAVSGRLPLVLHLQTYWQDVHQFTEIDLTFMERVRCYFNGVYACLFPLSHRLAEGRLYWQSVGLDLRPLGVAILFVALAGFWLHRRQRVYQLFLAWLLFQPLFFIVFAWSPLESPLFALYFSWAVVPLFCAGLEGVFGRFPRFFVCLVALLCAALLFVNVPQWLYVFSLLRGLYPVV